MTILQCEGANGIKLDFMQQYDIEQKYEKGIKIA